jgi:predicted Zn-dependent protease
MVGAQVPMLQGAIALAAHDGRRALTILDGALPFDRQAGPWLQYLRGLAHEALQDHRQAAEAFRAIVTRRGNQPANIVHTVAHLQLARALRGAGDTAGARQAYADFAAAWRSADPRHPFILSAAREAAALPTPTPAPR